jgi:hypothetical protein
VIEALTALKGPSKVELFTDSEYVRKGINEWIHNWKKRGWMTADKKPVKNSDLWRALDDATRRHRIKWRWVKGHDGDPGNERADALANLGAAEHDNRRAPMIGRERAVPLNRAVRSGTIANPRPEIGMACQHLISNRLMRQNVSSGWRVTGRRVRDIDGSGTTLARDDGDGSARGVTRRPVTSISAWLSAVSRLAPRACRPCVVAVAGPSSVRAWPGRPTFSNCSRWMAGLPW